MTGNDLISSALRMIGALASGETPSATEATDALVVLNQMIDGWTSEKLMISNGSRNIYPLTPGQQTYTLGPVVGALDQARPSKIERVSIQSLANPAQPLDIPIRYLTDNQWQHVPVKNLSTNLPNSVWDDDGFPSRTLWFYPVPNVAVNAIIWGWTALTQWPDLVTDITFPPGYIEAIKYNLAVRLAAEWPGTIAPTVIALAQTAKARVKASNMTIVDMRPNSMFTGGSGRPFNVFTGE